MTIKKITNKMNYADLLLLADPDINIVKEYLDTSDMFGLFEDNELLAEIVITKVDNDICELKNIATVDSARGKGYASDLIKYAFNQYKNKYSKIIVGTTENMIPFYVINGFNKYYKTVKNFFIDNYDKEVWDGDLQCIDMYYYYKDLKEKDVK